jgi:hypothetical protein
MKRNLSEKIYIIFGIMFSLIIISAIYCLYMNNKNQHYTNNITTNWFPILHMQVNLFNEYSNISNKHFNIISKYMNEKYEYKWDKDELIKMQNGFFENLEKYKKEEMRFRLEEVTTEEIYKSWKSYKENYEKDFELLDKNPNEAFMHFNLETSKSIILVSDSIKNEIEFYYIHGVNTEKKSNYLSLITNTTLFLLTGILILTFIIIFRIIPNPNFLIFQSILKLKNRKVPTDEKINSVNLNTSNLLSSVNDQTAADHETGIAINQISNKANSTIENVQETSKTSIRNLKIEDKETINRLKLEIQTIQELRSQLQNITEIKYQSNIKTPVINDLDSKSELLSLNALIETVRAGDYGKGFKEVENLAKISGKSANKIQELITSSQGQVNKILYLTKERFVDGKKVSNKTQNTFIKISENIQNLSSIIQEISDATKDLEVRISQISLAISQIDKVNQNSQNPDHLTPEAIKKLIQQCENLNTISNSLDLIVNGKIASKN